MAFDLPWRRGKGLLQQDCAACHVYGQLTDLLTAVELREGAEDGHAPVRGFTYEQARLAGRQHVAYIPEQVNVGVLASHKWRDNAAEGNLDPIAYLCFGRDLRRQNFSGHPCALAYLQFLDTHQVRSTRFQRHDFLLINLMPHLLLPMCQETRRRPGNRAAQTRTPAADPEPVRPRALVAD